ncbi:MAG TPA: glycosyltransferase [Streptosporangiaceae bacterium]|nr:glycosyltransferase [Streptosporangiaceae bacterium]
MTGVALEDAGASVVTRISATANAAGRLHPGPGRISVVICVYTERRWDDILAAVESVRGQSRPAHEIIVVVDHNPALLRRLEAELGIAERADSDQEARGAGVPAPDSTGPVVKLTSNREQRGLSGGKNTGVAAATGVVVAFLDDDAIAERDWLRYFADSYADDAVAGVGGLTLPRWDAARPGWFPREFDWVVGCNYLGMPESRQPVRNLLGGNASFRKDIFAVAGGFTTDVGRSGARLPLGGEETEFCIRIGQRRPNVRLLIDHRAVIWHRVPASRGRFSYFITRCYAEGLSKAQVSHAVGAAEGMSAERRHAAVTLPAGIGRGVAAAFRGDLAGFGRAAAIIIGLTAAAAGYAFGRISRRR